MPPRLPTPMRPDLTFADFETEERARVRARTIVERTFLSGGSAGVEQYISANAKPRVLAAMLDLRAAPDGDVRTILLSHHIRAQADAFLSRRHDPGFVADL
jgi:hypothetical protein